MTKTLTPKQRVEELFKVMSDSWNFGHKSPTDSKLVRRTARALERSVNTAFEKAGLDASNDEHWPRLALLFCAAIYGKTPGAPKKWSNKKQRQLLLDFSELKSKRPGLTEREYCAELCKRSAYGAHKGRVERQAETLRRQLQDAKRKAAKNEALKQSMSTALPKAQSTNQRTKVDGAA